MPSKVSVVVPTHNERENVGKLHERLAAVFAGLNDTDFELIFCDDSTDASALAVSLAALKDWTFLLGPGFIVGWGNGLILAYLMYRSGLIPRRLALLGLVGGRIYGRGGAAERLGLKPTTLQSRMKKLGVRRT